MHICLLSSARFPPNERLRKEAIALGEAGHAVTVCCRGAGDDPDREIIDGIDVKRLADGSLYAGAKGKLDGVRYALQFVQPAWVRAASEVDDERTIDVCGVQDLSLVKTGLKIGKNLDVPVVCDLPSAALDFQGGSAAGSRGGRLRGLARRVFHSPWRRKRLESKGVPNADNVITTCEEGRARYVREKGIDARRVAVVRDTALVTTTETDSRARELEFDPEAAVVVTVFADDTPTEGLEALVEAAARAADSAIDLRLVVVGDISQEALDDLETLAQRRLTGGRVTFRTETDRTTDYLAMSDACVLAHTSQATETAVPRKLFEALAFGVPVVVSDTGPASRVVTRTNAGRVVSVENTDALTDALVALSDSETAAELGVNAREAVEREYNWERDADRLLSVYESSERNSIAEEFTEVSRQNSTFTFQDS